MMRTLEWESLQQRRQEAKAVMMYSIVNSLVDIPSEHHLHQQGTAVTRGHQSRFMVPSTGQTHREQHSSLLLFLCGTSFQRAFSTPLPLMSSFFLSLYTAWCSLSSIIDRCTLYTPGCRMKAYK